MRHHRYPRIVLPQSFVSEDSTSEESQPVPAQTDWTNDEIAAIRLVLQKQSAVRIFNLNDAEDLVQETLLTMISKPPGNELEKGPLVWGLGILRRKVGNYYRKARRYMPLDEQDAGLQSCRRTVSPEGRLFQAEIQTIVGNALPRLPPAQRRALELLVAGFDSGEIAELLHPARYQNVINSLYRGRKKLARELARHGYVPNDGMSRMKISRGKFKNRQQEKIKALS